MGIIQDLYNLYVIEVVSIFHYPYMTLSCLIRYILNPPTLGFLPSVVRNMNISLPRQIYCSPLLRALQTAHLALPNQEGAFVGDKGLGFRE